MGRKEEGWRRVCNVIFSLGVKPNVRCKDLGVQQTGGREQDVPLGVKTPGSLLFLSRVFATPVVWFRFSCTRRRSNLKRV